MTELPNGWTIAPLGEIADTQLGKMLNRSNQVGDATVPYLRNVNVQWGRIDMSDVKQMDIYPDEVAKFMAEPGDLLVCEGGESGRAAIWNGSSAIGIQNALHRIRPKAGISSRYLLYYFEWQVKSRMIDHLLSGVTISHFTQEKLRKMLVQYPPLEEQERIVEVLDEHLSRLDKALAEVSLAAKKTEAFIKSYLLSLVQGSASTCHDSGSWQKMQIGSLGKWRGGGTPSKSNPTFWLDGQIPWLTAKDMKTFRIRDTQDHITEAGVAGSSANLFPSKAVVVVTRSGILEWKLPVALTEVPVTVNQDLKALVCNADVLPEWAAYSILGFEHRILDECRKAGTTVANLNFEDFLKFEIFVPPIERQQELSNLIQESIDYLDSIRTRVNTLQTTLTDMRRSILNNAFLGALVKD
jgi:type I restriction enzyme, S subunit